VIVNAGRSQQAMPLLGQFCVEWDIKSRLNLKPDWYYLHHFRAKLDWSNKKNESYTSSNSKLRSGFSTAN